MEYLCNSPAFWEREKSQRIMVKKLEALKNTRFSVHHWKIIMNQFKKLLARNSFLHVASTSFPGPTSVWVAIHKIVIPDNIHELCGGQDSHTQGLPSGLFLSCFSKCCQMLSEFTHHKSVTKINKCPGLLDCVSEVLGSALLGNGSVRAAWLFLRGVKTRQWWNKFSDCLCHLCSWLPQPAPFLPFPATSLAPWAELQAAGVGTMNYWSRGLLWMKSSFSVSWWYFGKGCLDRASVYVSVSRAAWETLELQNFIDF